MIAILWVALICIMFFLPPYKVSIPGQEGWSWEYVNYAPVARRRGVHPLRRLVRPLGQKWFKGPVRMGTEEELEALEEQTLGQYALPTKKA